MAEPDEAGAAAARADRAVQRQSKVLGEEASEASIQLPGAAAAGPPPPRTVAVVVAHGMGQQVPYQTLAQVVEGLHLAECVRNPAAAPLAASSPSFEVRVVPLGGKQVARAEMTLDGPGGPTRVHAYEAYWAPLTEGKVTLKDVTGFIVAGAWNGVRATYLSPLLNFLRGLVGLPAQPPFQRWLFGQQVRFDLGYKTSRYLALALGVLVALVAMHLVAAAVVVSHGYGFVLGTPPAWALDAFGTLTFLTLLFVVVALLMLALLGLGGWWKGRRVRRARTRLVQDHAAGVAALHEAGAPRVVAGAAAFLLYAAIGLALLFDAVLLGKAVLWIWDLVGDAPDWSLARAARVPTLPAWLVLATWAAVAYVSRKAQGFLVQYLGDVAAYVSQHKLDRFKDVRDQVKACVLEVVAGVYAARRPDGAFEYDEVALVGHSLGSVVAYEALNGMVNRDLMSPGGGSDAVGRTGLFLTFGSPLDKIAFFYGLNGSGPVHAALSAAHQPLVQDYAHRAFPWVNVYARRDVIAGALDFYDAPGQVENSVRDEEDTLARLPLAAHNEYWDDVALWEILHRHVTAPPAA